MSDNTNNTDDETQRLEDALEHDPAVHPEAQVDDQTEGSDPDPAAGDTPEPETPEPETAAKPVTPTPPRKLSGAAKSQHEAKVAREQRLKEAQAQLPEGDPPSEAELAELERRADLEDRLSAIADEIQEHEDGIDAKKAEAREVMAALYPHTVKSDRHVDAVRGYLKASQDERRNRGAHPARLKELLLRAGKAPIDAAFQRARARGQGRPTRSPMGQSKAPGQEQAKEATPGAQE